MILELRHVSYSISNQAILRDISLTVGQGETVVLLGRSGSGKTTLLKTINRLVPVTSGEVIFEGRPTSGWDPIRLRRRMGYVIQDAGLFPHWTVAQNVEAVPRLDGWDSGRTEKRANELLAAVGLDPAVYRHRYPRQLSGGEKQRVGIARALAADPPLLLLDEPFASLDPITRYDLQRQFLQLRSTMRKASLFVTHDVREAMMMASRIALLKTGSLELLATTREFAASQSIEARAFLASLEENWRENERP